jgi:alkylhydroperoxidase/carboxymuconolactone decarboxylase family protein YurZ
MPQQSLPEDLAAAYASYQPLLGTLPAELATRFAVSGELAPEFLVLFERIRAYVFYSETFDEKVTQLLIFGMFLALHRDAARLHALAARRAGATWPEIHKVIELAALVGGFTALTIGDMIIAQLREGEALSKEVDE